MKHSTGTPTKSQVRRFEALQLLGCIACRKRGYKHYPAEIHHLNLGGKAGQKRLGHDFTIPLCAWHHRGDSGMFKVSSNLERFGPSLAKSSKAFRIEFGTDDELLSEVNALIGEA